MIKTLPKNSAIIIREYDLKKEEREIFARKIAKLARARSLKILVGKDFGLAKKIKADGVHFSDRDRLPLQFFKKKSFPKNFLFSFSCHSAKAFLRARKFRPDMVFLSPVFATTSNPETKFLRHSSASSDGMGINEDLRQSLFGLRNFAKIAVQNKNSLSIYALGGINSQNLKILTKLKIKGFGAIDYFYENHTGNSLWRFGNKAMAGFP